MDLLSWIDKNRPGKVTSEGDRIEISHSSGEYSTLWLNLENNHPSGLIGLGDIYKKYDGIDLFSSTFKIASVGMSKGKNGVEITPTLKELSEELLAENAEIPQGSIPFMVQQGIGIYSFRSENGLISEWDSELSEFTQQFPDLTAIFDEWLIAVET